MEVLYGWEGCHHENHRLKACATKSCPLEKNCETNCGDWVTGRRAQAEGLGSKRRAWRSKQITKRSGRSWASSPTIGLRSEVRQAG